MPFSGMSNAGLDICYAYFNAVKNSEFVEFNRRNFQNLTAIECVHFHSSQTGIHIQKNAIKLTASEYNHVDRYKSGRNGYWYQITNYGQELIENECSGYEYDYVNEYDLVYSGENQKNGYEKLYKTNKFLADVCENNGIVFVIAKISKDNFRILGFYRGVKFLHKPEDPKPLRFLFKRV